MGLIVQTLVFGDVKKLRKFEGYDPSETIFHSRTWDVKNYVDFCCHQRTDHIPYYCKQSTQANEPISSPVMTTSPTTLRDLMRR